MSQQKLEAEDFHKYKESICSKCNYSHESDPTLPEVMECDNFKPEISEDCRCPESPCNECCVHSKGRSSAEVGLKEAIRLLELADFNKDKVEEGEDGLQKADKWFNDFKKLKALLKKEFGE